MKYFTGDCIEFFSEICADKVNGTTITLISVTDPLGNVITLNSAMSFGTDADNTNIASTTYQLSETANAGRWTYLVQASNGSKNNYDEGYFFVEAK